MTPYLIFWPKDPSLPWWRRFWKGRYGHISILFHDDETWVAVSVEHDGVRFKAMHRAEEVDEYLTLCCAYATVVRIFTEENPRPAFFRPMTCVSFVRHAFGIRSRALFPDGLLRDCLRTGIAEVVNDEDPEGQGNTGAEG